MNKITRPTKPKDRECIFTEGINYFATGKKSIWGIGDKDAIQLLNKLKLNGKWLNLAAGDGRYSSLLLEKVDFITVSDIDKSALSKLWHNTPEKHRHKLKIKPFNIVKKFPFKNESFEGVFCTGALHLFPRKVLQKIISEINRVTKRNGRVVIDFACDIKRISPDGRLRIFGNEPLYNFKDAKAILRDLLRNYQIKMYKSEVTEKSESSNPPYILKCKFIILIADKI